MKKNMRTLCATGLLVSLLTSVSTSASATTVFFDSFEDGDANGWFESATGSGTTGVIGNNGSLRGYANTPNLGYRSLSQDFEYANNHVLSFEMQVIANPGIKITFGGSSTTPGSGGAKISFLNSFNGILGDSVFFIHRTDGVKPPAYAGVFQDETLNFFSARLIDYAALAGLDRSSNIAKFSLEFFASSGGGGGGNGSSLATASTWFDNVNIAPVPIPGAMWLFGTGLIGLLSQKRRETFGN